MFTMNILWIRILGWAQGSLCDCSRSSWPSWPSKNLAVSICDSPQKQKVCLGHKPFLGSAAYWSVHVGPSTAVEHESQVQKVLMKEAGVREDHQDESHRATGSWHWIVSGSGRSEVQLDKENRSLGMLLTYSDVKGCTLWSELWQHE